MKRTKLSGRRIAILVADGFEKIELLAPARALKAAGARIDIISLWPGKIRGLNLHEPSGKIKVDKTISDCASSSYDGLFIPGGFINPDLLRQSLEAREFVKKFDQEKKAMASLCHGPWLLASAGLLAGRTLTSSPGIRDDLVNAGATWLNQATVRDGNLVTARGPGDLGPFIQELVQLFSETPPITENFVNNDESAEQAIEAPLLSIGPVNWIKSPSLRALAGLCVLALGFKLYQKLEL